MCEWIACSLAKRLRSTIVDKSAGQKSQSSSFRKMACAVKSRIVDEVWVNHEDLEMFWLIPLEIVSGR